MEGEEPKSPSLQEDSRLYQYSERLAENVVGFQQFIDEVVEAIEEDESFNEMTAESYEQKKSSMKSHFLELSVMHNSLADEFGDLIEEVSKHCPALGQNQHLESSDSTSPQVTQTLAPTCSTVTGFDVLWQSGGGGFYLSKGKGSESEVPPVNDDDALKVDETKDDNALKVEETKDREALVEKISNMEEEMASLKQKLQSLTDENYELKFEIEENIADVGEYMSESKLEIETKEEELKELKEMTAKTDQHMAGVLVEKIVNQTKHEYEIKEMIKRTNQYMTEISELKATHEKKEKICNDIIRKLNQELKEKCELVEELSNHMNILVADKSSQNIVIHQLKTELDSIKYEDVGVLPSLDNVQKLTDELKLKVAELETEVDRQRDAMSNME